MWLVHGVKSFRRSSCETTLRFKASWTFRVRPAACVCSTLSPRKHSKPLKPYIFHLGCFPFNSRNAHNSGHSCHPVCADINLWSFKPQHWALFAMSGQGYAFECTAADGTDDVQLQSFPMDGCGDVQQVMLCLCKKEGHQLALELISDNSNSELACQATEDEKYWRPLFGCRCFPSALKREHTVNEGKGLMFLLT